MRGIKKDSPSGLLFLRGKPVSNCIVDLIVAIPSLEADLIARKVSVEKEGLNA